MKAWSRLLCEPSKAVLKLKKQALMIAGHEFVQDRNLQWKNPL